MTRDELAALFDYDPLSGILMRKSTGRPAGSPHGNGYLRVNINGLMLYAHRIAFVLHFGYEPEFVDHRNGNRGYNVATNLRDCTQAQNNKNKAKRRNARSPFIGVSFCKSTGRWRAQFRMDGKPVSIGRFNSEIEAARAYDETALAHNGEFARVNNV